jgi:hypothetical protein
MNYGQQMITLNQQSQSQHSPHDNKQMEIVTSALKELNKLLSPERQIKLILFLYSKFSKKSEEIINQIHPDCRKFFYYICIDSKLIREKIVKSTTIKITEVPCIILIDINDTISTYEGDKSFDIIKTIYNISTQSNQQQSQPNFQPRKSQTSLEDVIETSQHYKQDSQYPSEGKYPPKRSPIPDILPTPIDDDDEEDKVNEIEDNATRLGGVRSKIRGATRPMDEMIPEQERPDVGMSIRPQLPKGKGHEKLAISSLSQIPTQQPARRDTIRKKDIEILDDIEDLDDFDIDPPMKTKPDKKESMDSVKKAAAEMAKMREEENS